MNDAQHAAYATYTRSLADALCLKDWVFVLRRESSDEGTRAQIHLSDKKTEAAITLCERWFVRTPEEQRQTLVHELLHAHTARLCRVVTRLKDQVGGETVGYVDAALDEEEEIAIDTLSRILAPFMPLPPEVPR
jgi:hypothetical protein